jgi:hypothetical protein
MSELKLDADADDDGSAELAQKWSSSYFAWTCEPRARKIEQAVPKSSSVVAVPLSSGR